MLQALGWHRQRVTVCCPLPRPVTCLRYNLGGMGCSAGVISIDLAKQLIRNRPNSLAVVVSTENLTQQLYLGNKRSMLLQNTLFRCGGAAMLLSSRYKDGFRAKCVMRCLA